MTIVSSSAPIIYFHDQREDTDETPAISSAGYLQRRESAERAAAKSSPTLAGRRVHQELAQLMYAERKRIQAAAKDGSKDDD